MSKVTVRVKSKSRTSKTRRPKVKIHYSEIYSRINVLDSIFKLRTSEVKDKTSAGVVVAVTVVASGKVSCESLRIAPRVLFAPCATRHIVHGPSFGRPNYNVKLKRWTKTSIGRTASYVSVGQLAPGRCQLCRQSGPIWETPKVKKEHARR